MRTSRILSQEPDAKPYASEAMPLLVAARAGARAVAHTDAVDALETPERAGPNHEGTCERFVAALFAADRRDEALGACAKALDRFPMRPRLHLLAGARRLSGGHAADAVRCLRRARTL